MQHKLVAVIGNTPQVLTETFWALRVDGKTPIDEVFVLTTKMGKKTCEARLFGEGRFAKLLADYGIEPVVFDPEHILVFENEDGKLLEDIRTSDENRLARDRIFQFVEAQTRDDGVALHCSLAGGRKSMGFLLGTAMQFFGRPQDRLYHVLVDPYEAENSVSFYYRTPSPEPVIVINRETNKEEPLMKNGQPVTSADVRIELAEMPYVSVRALIAFSAGGYENIQARVQEAVRDYPHIKAENAHLRRVAGNPGGMIGQSRAIRKVKDQIARAAQVGAATVLILGETGTGKELTAQAIHDLSDRSPKPFKAINCGALSDELLLAELFGAKKGAYTGLPCSRTGLFQAAQGGTIFLDEIGELSPKGQQSLLRVLQEQRVRPLGSNEEVEIDVRVIAATNRDVKDMVEAETFREDLFYRLNVLPIFVPSLRECREDIPAMIDAFCEEFNRKHRRTVVGLDGEALEVMMQYAWPGNVRELKNMVERIVISAPPGAFRVHRRDLPAELLQVDEIHVPFNDLMQMPYGEAIELLQRMLIQKALQETGGNLSQAASSLGMTPKGLRGAIDRLELGDLLNRLRSASGRGN